MNLISTNRYKININLVPALINLLHCLTLGSKKKIKFKNTKYYDERDGK